ncbi:Hypothetical protein I596_1116 [Dokdonella koreensis DS-123]|uniref:Uncharacterized protein n=1 Tax=Dokdonella koreensis DS-123 TaxID=1300342 RepID=A0A167GQN7_9GAMM|nr:Hypothetical protein I596_1116 [Dokdonella koreensis DS-123]
MPNGTCLSAPTKQIGNIAMVAPMIWPLRAIKPTYGSCSPNASRLAWCSSWRKGCPSARLADARTQPGA